jgi:AbrB family looped-hinge helix DNA binding protein
MALSKIRPKGQLTIPSEIREAANLEEGVVVELAVTDEGVLLRPKVMVDAEDAWFWSESWQEGEKEASGELAAGKGQAYESGEDFLAALDEHSK